MNSALMEIRGGQVDVEERQRQAAKRADAEWAKIERDLLDAEDRGEYVPF